MKQVLVVGSTGFVGRNLIKYLDKRSISNIGFNRPELMSEKFAMFNDCETIVHLAGKAHDTQNAANPNEYYDVNYRLTRKIYDAFIESNSKKFIFLSSVKACADSIEDYLTETNPCHPSTHYGISKKMAEDYILNRELPDGKLAYILRPCMIHGPGNKGNLNLLYQVVRKHIPYPLAAFENRRSFLSVENLCFVIHQFVNRDDITSGVYHVADDEALSTNELIHLIGKFSGTRTFLWKIPPGLIGLIAKVGDKLNLPLNTERLKKLTENYIVDNSKLKVALDCELPISTREGLKKTIGFFQQQ